MNSILDAIDTGDTQTSLGRAINSDWRICDYPYPHIRTAPKGRAAYVDSTVNKDGEAILANDYRRSEIVTVIEAAPALARAGRRLLLAIEALANHPANDSTKAFDAKLYEKEAAEDELAIAVKAALGDLALEVEEEVA